MLELTMTTHPLDARILNALVVTLLASIADYRKCSREVGNRALAKAFDARADERRRAAAKLQSAVAEAGGEPEHEGSLLAAARHPLIAGADGSRPDDEAICDEIERREDAIRKGFEKAFADIELSPAARAAVHEAWELVKLEDAEQAD
jgi:uncharacterized protein (TIGR02284 family)